MSGIPTTSKRRGPTITGRRRRRRRRRHGPTPSARSRRTARHSSISSRIPRRTCCPGFRTIPRAPRSCTKRCSPPTTTRTISGSCSCSGGRSAPGPTSESAGVRRRRMMVRQAVLRAPYELTLRDVPEPDPGPGEVVVRIRAALTCGTDLKTYRRGHPRVPFGPFGHECAGCRAGRENLCETLFDEIAVGAYADAIRLPARIVRRHLLPKPAPLSYIEAAFLEPLACVVHGWRRLGAAPG